LQKPLTATPEREEFGTLHLTFFAAGAVIAFTPYSYSCLKLGWWPDWITWLYMVPYLAATGFSIGAVMLALFRRWTGANTFPQHFGHWFLLWCGIGWFVIQPYETIYYTNRQVPIDLAESYHAEQGVSPALTTARTIHCLVTMLLIGWAIWRCRHERTWRLYGVFRIANALLTCLHPPSLLQSNPWIYAMLDCLITLAVVFWLGLSLYLDLRRREARDYLHWVGIVVEGMLVGQLVKYSVSLVRWALEHPLF
jgi:hypothetical protein